MNNDGRRTTDARSISFPLQIVVLIVSGLLSSAGAMVGAAWVVSAKIGVVQSDVRDIKTTMEGQQRLTEQKDRLSDERLGQMRDAITDMKRRQELQQYEINSFKEVIMRLEAKGLK